MQKYFIKTFGCQMNYSDSERIASFLEARGLKPTEDSKSADLVIFNTCGVRQMAEDRVYGQIHNLSKRRPKPLIILTGCLAERKDVKRRLKNKVDLFTNIKNFTSEVAELISPSEKKYVKPYLYLKPKYDSPFSAYVPVMTGCDNFCSYCVVPYARGQEVSRPAAEIVTEIQGLLKKGYKMITLLGQNVNSYRDNKINFPQLLKKIDSLPGNFWLTFLTSHPKDMSDELIEAIARSRKVLEFVHLPIQSGDNITLEKMNRKYSRAHYLKLIAKIKKSFAQHKPRKLYGIAGDIIVGFPGETRKQFLKSAEIMKKVKYDMVYFGQFSPRPGTPAAKMKDNVSKKEKERRESYLNEILKTTALANNQKYLAKTLDILIESEKKGFYFGKTRTMKNIKIQATKNNLVGKIIKVRITGAKTWNLEGAIIK